MNNSTIVDSARLIEFSAPAAANHAHIDSLPQVQV
jgi:hypothetical protein